MQVGEFEGGENAVEKLHDAMDGNGRAGRGRRCGSLPGSK